MKNWKLVPYREYLNTVEKLLDKTYGITSNDVNEKRIQAAHEDGDAPEDFVQWIGNKYDLTEIKPLEQYSIHQLNDLFRDTFIGGRVMLTQGITSLSDEDREEIITKVRTFDNFTPDNDPYGEHDFGSFDHNGKKIFWKIDYYDQTLTYGSENPSDPRQTRRVLTIMLAGEY